MKTKHIGIMSILLASIMWAIEPIFIKIAYNTSDFIQTSAIRAAFAALIALIYISIKNKRELKINKKQLSVLFYIAIIGVLFADLMYLFALSQVPVLNAALIGHMQPIFIILFGFIFLKNDRLNKYDYLGISFMCLSALFVTTKTYENLTEMRFGTLGDLIVLSATIAWATAAIAMRRHLKTMDAGAITFYRFFISSIVLVFYLIIISNLQISNLYQIIIGIIVGIGTILYYEGLKRLKAAQVGGIELCTPFFAAIFGFLVLNEIVTIMQIIGIIILFIGMFFISKKEEI